MDGGSLASCFRRWRGRYGSPPPAGRLLPARYRSKGSLQPRFGRSRLFSLPVVPALVELRHAIDPLHHRCSSCRSRTIRGGTASPTVARRGTAEEQGALALVTGERGGALELAARFDAAPELDEQIAAHARQQVVGLERRLGEQR